MPQNKAVMLLYEPLRCFRRHLQPQRSGGSSPPWQHECGSRGSLGSSCLRQLHTLTSDEPAAAENDEQTS